MFAKLHSCLYQLKLAGPCQMFVFVLQNQAFENQHLAVPALKWLGILPTDIAKQVFECPVITVIH